MSDDAGWLKQQFEECRREISERPEWVKNAVRFDGGQAMKSRTDGAKAPAAGAPERVVGEFGKAARLVGATFERSKRDPEYIPECSYLGDTAICLASTYEGHNDDCRFIEEALRRFGAPQAGPAGAVAPTDSTTLTSLQEENERLREALGQIRATASDLHDVALDGKRDGEAINWRQIWRIADDALSGTGGK